MAQKTIDFENDILRPIGSLKEDSVNKHGVGEVTKENAEFIKNDALIDIPQKNGKPPQQVPINMKRLLKTGFLLKVQMYEYL